MGKLWKLRDEFILYKKRDKGEAIVDDVRVVEEGAADYGTRGLYDPPKLWFPCSSFVFLFVVPCAMAGGTEVDTSAGTLSEAKTQRRPHSARDIVRGGGFLCCFVVFVSFFEQGKKKTRRGDGHGEGGRKGEARRWFKRAAA